jgi:hypothetical protein
MIWIPSGYVKGRSDHVHRLDHSLDVALVMIPVILDRLATRGGHWVSFPIHEQVFLDFLFLCEVL